ncbi:Lachesin [Eumeta japonica]|uniref:Lachesin n=1 Tax=Eumeta variegata TaxID=151549 RepID=A0A4C1Z346_EUMVA|nr:Lachesin [Eumeta japonica]
MRGREPRRSMRCDRESVHRAHVALIREICEVHGHAPSINIKLTPDKAQFGANSVTIHKLTRADSGTYICYATNDIGKGNAKKINIKVLGKPHVRVQRPVINSAPNIEAVLECTVHEEPPAEIHWYKDGELVNITKFMIETIEQNSTLRVTPQTEDEFGVFTCKAENPYGTHERSIKLVQYPVIDTLKPVNGTTFRWTITSHLPLEQIELNIKERSEKNWGNVSIPVPEAINHSYDVKYVMSTDSYRPGNYSAIIRAKNSAEWRESEDAQEIELAAQHRHDLKTSYGLLLCAGCLRVCVPCYGLPSNRAALCSDPGRRRPAGDDGAHRALPVSPHPNSLIT